MSECPDCDFRGERSAGGRVGWRRGGDIVGVEGGRGVGNGGGGWCCGGHGDDDDDDDDVSSAVFATAADADADTAATLAADADAVGDAVVDAAAADGAAGGEDNDEESGVSTSSLSHVDSECNDDAHERGDGVVGS